jgi:hypothetical protein
LRSRLSDRIKASVSTGLSARDTLLPIAARGAISGWLSRLRCMPPLACYREHLRSLCPMASWVPPLSDLIQVGAFTIVYNGRKT